MAVQGDVRLEHCSLLWLRTPAEHFCASLCRFPGEQFPPAVGSGGPSPTRGAVADGIPPAALGEDLSCPCRGVDVGRATLGAGTADHHTTTTWASLPGGRDGHR